MTRLRAVLASTILAIAPLQPPSLAGEMNWRTDARLISYLSWKDLHSTSQNPDNQFLGLYRNQARAEFRPDLFLSTPTAQFMLKPRAYYESRWDLPGLHSQDETDSTSDLYVTEGLAQFPLTPTTFVSYGRENLQWGPSFLRTPSNPFFLDNGRQNPKLEVEGADFLKAVYLPTDSITLSAISNLDRGALRSDPRLADGRFDRQHAIKLDVVGSDYNSAVILSRKEGVESALGGYFQKTMTDALLVYLDATLKRGSAVLYPRLDPAHPIGGYFEPRHEDSTEQRFIGLTGISYTLENSATFTIEYLYNGAGYSHTEASDYYLLRDMAAQQLDDPALGSLARANLAAALDPGSLLLRRHYLFAQYAFNEMGSDLAYTLRHTWNLDDRSTNATAIIEYALGESFQIFAIANHYAGRANTEFPSLFHNDVMVGFEYSL